MICESNLDGPCMGVVFGEVEGVAFDSVHLYEFKTSVSPYNMVNLFYVKTYSS